MSDRDAGFSLICLGMIGMACGIPHVGWLVVLGVIML